MSLELSDARFGCPPQLHALRRRIGAFSALHAGLQVYRSAEKVML